MKYLFDDKTINPLYKNKIVSVLPEEVLKEIRNEKIETEEYMLEVAQYSEAGGIEIGTITPRINNLDFEYDIIDKSNQAIINLDTNIPTNYLPLDGRELTILDNQNIYNQFDTNIVNDGVGHGKPWQQQYYIERPDPGNLQWEETTPLPEPVGWGISFITKNKVYVCGGSRSGANTTALIVNRVHTAPINEDGTIGDWVTAPSLPGALHASQAVVTKNRVYLLGGHNGVIISTIYTASINEDGTIGDWVTAPSLPGALYANQAVVTKNRVYLLGGHNGVIISTIYTASINEDGTIGDWVTAPSLPGALHNSQAVVTKNRVYLLGGHNGSTSVSTIYTAPINEDGTIGDWEIDSPLPGALHASQAVVTKNRVYLLGGHNGSTSVSTIYTAPINEDGTIGDWETTQNFPILRHGSESVVTTSNFVYVLGGREGATWKDSARVFRAPLAGGFNSYMGKYSDMNLPLQLPNIKNHIIKIN